MIQTSLHPLDVLIIVLYLAMLAGVGVYFSRRQKSLDEYFLAKQSMAWLPVGLSLMAALDSAIDYLMQPSATIKYGLFLLIGTSSWLFLYPWVSKVTLPFYRRLNYFTAYEYLEARFDVRVRGLAAVINLLDPDVIVLGGGMSNVDRLYAELPLIWQPWVFSDRVDTRLAKAVHGDSSGVRGAAWLWPRDAAGG